MGVCSENAKFKYGIVSKTRENQKNQKTNVSRTTLISGLVAKSLVFLVFSSFFFFQMVW